MRPAASSMRRFPGNLEHEDASRMPDDAENGPRKILKDGEKKRLDQYHCTGKDRRASCKSFTLKLVLFSFFVAASLTFLCPPISYSELQISFRSSFTESARSKARYNVDTTVKLSQISSIVGTLEANNAKGLEIGLINFNKPEEVQEWKVFAGQRNVYQFSLEHLEEDIQWIDIFPEWIDEEELNEVPRCPYFPMPLVRAGTTLDLVVAKIPCHSSASSRDVVRLQVQLAAATVALATQSKHVLLISSCRPLPNLFTCAELAATGPYVWLFKVEHAKLRKKLSLPVGSCELAVPVENRVPPSSVRGGKREAYATILHSAEFYVCGAITVAQSILMTGSTRDLVILVDENIQQEHVKGLQAAGWIVIKIQRIRNPKAEPEAYNEWNYSKFRLWQLTNYEKIIFIDADLLVLRNIDFLFELPEISAIGNNATLFNSGVMIIEPSNCTFQLLMDQIDEIVSYNGGDQGYLNEIFTWWHRIPRRMNYLKHFWSNDTEEFEEKTRLFKADPPELYVLHYLGLKPWLCFRDYDCNWNVENQRSYASDVAHARWWKIHDKMSEGLQQFCILKSKQKAQLEWDRQQAANASFPDEHWKRNITDPRLKICSESFCYWESMLWHWGDPAYFSNDSSSSNQTNLL